MGSNGIREGSEQHVLLWEAGKARRIPKQKHVGDTEGKLEVRFEEGFLGWGWGGRQTFRRKPKSLQVANSRF